MLHLGIRRKLHKIKKNIYNWWFRIVPCRWALHRGKKRSENIVVSLSSYPGRFNTLHIMLKSVMYQSVKPDRIIVNLNEKTKDVLLPQSFNRMQKYGIEVIYRHGEIEPHRKYYYTLIECQNDIVITLDDDVIYDRNIIKRLLNSYKINPECISAGRVHQMMADENGSIMPYSKWKYECKNVFLPDHSLLAVGVGAVLYPPNCFPIYYPDIELIENYCPFADDLLLKFMEIINEKKVVWVPWKRPHPFTINGSQDTNLVSANKAGRNDKYICMLENRLCKNLGTYAVIDNENKRYDCI